MISTNDFAAKAGLQPDTIRKYVQRGLIKPARRIGSCLIFDESEVSRFQKSRHRRGHPGKK